MGIMSFIKKQFIDVIDWTESGDGVLAYRYPMQDREIQNGAQLTVRDSQLAVFVNEGQIADIFGPGLYTLNTRTLPLLTSLRNWDKAFQSPFKSDLYFFSTREQLDQKWGTPQPVTIRDKEFGVIRLRAFGNYSYQLKDPKLFYQKISGTRDAYATQELEGQLRSVVLTSMASFFGSAEVAFLDMAANQQKFSDTLKEALSIPFKDYGLDLRSFRVESVSLPEELQSYLDKKSSMNMLGDLQKYAQFQAADSISTAAANPGGIAGAGVGLGAGVAIGQSMAGALSGLGSGGGTAGKPVEAQDAVAMLGKLHELLTQGILTQAEFDAKKAELLKRIT
jgi:membrane protease subunit (stomatin/prohibitin family)